MTDEIARLGITIDSTQAATAAANLDKLDASGRKVSDTTQRMQDRLNKQSDAMRRLAQETQRSAGLDQLAASGQKSETVMRAIDAAARRVGISVADMEKRIDATTNAMRRMSDAQARIDRTTGVDLLPNSGRGADIAAYGSALDSVRAKYNPLFAAGQQYRDTLVQINQAARVGAISEKERVDAITRTKTAFTDQVKTIRGVGSATDDAAKNLGTLASKTGLARYELINLSRQIQDVVVSLGSGQGVGTVALQQGTQIGDIFASSKASLGDFAQQAKGWLGSFLTIGRVAFGGVTLAIGAGATALLNYEKAQERVAQSLTGIGRASGATIASINQIGVASSTTFGLSTKEAVDFASEIASVGLVTKDVISRATGLGKNLSIVLGVEAKDAATALARTLADPVRNLDAMNSRLGAFSASTKAQIEDLVAQNRLGDAQALILDKIAQATKGASDVTTGWSKAWTALANAASNAWFALGRGIDGALGLNQPIQQKYNDAKKRLDDLVATRDAEQKYRDSIGGNDLFSNDTRMNDLNRQIDEARRKAEEFKRQMEGAATASDQVRRNMESVANRSLMSSLMPEIDARRELANNRARAGALAEDPLAQRDAGVTQKQATRGAAIATDLDQNFRTRFEQMQSQLRLANEQITAFSPVAKAIQARKEMLDSLKNVPMDPAEKEQAGQLAYANALKQSTTALSEQARVRLLTANQSVTAQQNEIDMIGKTAGQQAEMRANLQARQQLEQEASQNRTKFNQAEFEQLQKINAELGRRAQLQQVRQLQSDIGFERSQIGLSDADAAANSRLRGIFGDDLNSAQAQFLKRQLLINDALKQANDIGKEAFKGIGQDILAGKSGLEALTNALNRFAARLMDMVMDRAWSSIFKMFSGGLGGALGGGGFFSTLFGVHHSGYGPGDTYSTRAVNTAVLRNAPRFHTGIGPGERAAVIRDDESVLTPGQMRALAPVGSGAQVKNEINIVGGGINPNDVEVRQTEDGRGNVKTDVMLDVAFANALSKSGSQTRRALSNNYNARPVGVRR